MKLPIIIDKNIIIAETGSQEQFVLITAPMKK